MKEYVDVIYSVAGINWVTKGCALTGGNREIGAAENTEYKKAKRLWKEDAYVRQRKFVSSE